MENIMNHPEKILVEGVDEEELTSRDLENCVSFSPILSGISGMDNWEIGVCYHPISAREIMRDNFFGIAEYEQKNSLSKVSPEEYVRRGLTCSVPWKAETLHAACPFHKGRYIFETHFLGLVKVQKWNGSIPSAESPYELQWILQLIRAPLSKKEVLSLVLPAEYKPQRTLDEEQNKAMFLIKRKPDREEY